MSRHPGSASLKKTSRRSKEEDLMRLIRLIAFIAPSALAVGLFILAFTVGGDRLTATVSPDAVWQAVDESSGLAVDGPAADSSRLLHLNKDALTQQLARAPMEGTTDLRNS